MILESLFLFLYFIFDHNLNFSDDMAQDVGHDKPSEGSEVQLIKRIDDEVFDDIGISDSHGVCARVKYIFWYFFVWSVLFITMYIL